MKDKKTAPQFDISMYEAWLSCSQSLSYQARQRLKAAHPDLRVYFDKFPAVSRDLVGKKAYEELSALREKGLPKLEEALERSDIKVTIPGDENYPDLLTSLEDKPDLLFYRGVIKKEEPRAIAMVGSRRETRYGREQAFRIARELAENGVTVVSGLARGIDTAAHLGALEAGGCTIGILGSGIKNIYPKENEQLAERIIASGGALVSEFAPTAEPMAYHFPIRNRLVSGFCQGVVLIEAREKSGTLITVGHALLQGREVFALPGPVDAPGSAVPHRMLREGARLITCGMDLMEDLGWAKREQPSQTSFILPDLTNEERRLYDALCHEPLDYQALMEATDIQSAQLNVLLTGLEMKDLIETLPGRVYKARTR